MTQLLLWAQTLMLALGVVSAGDDTPVKLYAIVGGIALVLVIVLAVVTIVSQKKKNKK